MVAVNGNIGNKKEVGNLSPVRWVGRICSMSEIDYLAIGHITEDIVPTAIVPTAIVPTAIVPTGRVTGGTVAYAGRTAQVLGCRTAVLTSAAATLDWAAALPGIQVKVIPAAETTTFHNIYTDEGRIQYLHGRANNLRVTDLPSTWQQPAVVHLAPLANEVDVALIDRFSGSLVGLTPQGWLRRWDENGRIHPCPWEAAVYLLPRAGAVILSEEDLPDAALLLRYRELAQLLVLTQGAAGCTVFMAGEQRHLPAPTVPEIEATGAGDIFAAAFLVRLGQTAGNPWEAARFANKLAAQSVTQRGLPAKIEAIRNVMGET
jgi:sugar/nucleoside kinase (ribokinase family)